MKVLKDHLKDHEHDEKEEIPLALAEATGTSVPLSTARAAQGSSPSWDQLDKRYYYGLMPIAPFLVRLVTYPSNLVKTRLQSAPTIYPYKNTFDAFKTIVAKQGVVGLYRGMGFNMVGMLQDPIYMTTMELTKGWLFQKQTTATSPTLLSRLFSSPASQASAVSFFSGSLAAMLVLTIAVPVDVVTQRLMIQQHPDRHTSNGKGGSAVSTSNTYIPPRSTTGTGTGVPAMAMRHMHTTSTPSPPFTVRNGFQMLNDIYHSQGLSGVYRGLGTSMFLYVPFCGILWSTFAGSRVICDQFLHVHPHHHVTTHVHDSHQHDVLLAIPHKQPWIKKQEPPPPEPSSEWRYMASLTTSALIAGIAASALTNPIDVIRTRLQVSDGASPTLRSIYTGMIREHGSAFRGLTSGLLARIMAGGPTNAILVSAYEIIKRVAVKKEQPRTIMTP